MTSIGIKMCTKISLEKLLFIYILWYEVLCLFCANFIPGLENKLFILLVIGLYFYLAFKVAHKRRKMVVFVNSVLLVYIGYYSLQSGLAYIKHLDFYSYVGLVFIFIMAGTLEIQKEFWGFLVAHWHQCIIMLFCYFGMLFFSILFKNGLKHGYGVSFPLLYGPYDVPHIVGYSLLFVYCICACLYKIRRSYLVLGLKAACIICVVWTATRSAVLAMAILVFLDFLSMKNVDKKTVIIVVGLLVLLYLALFTDFLWTNPITQKTISALKNEGSLTNNREIFSSIVLKNYFENSTWLQKILGQGIDGVRKCLKDNPAVNVAIHAHNDYVNLLCGYGMVGFFCMVYGQLKLFEFNKKKCMVVLAELFLVALMYTNGLAMYTLSTPLIIFLTIFISLSQGRLESAYINGQGER